MDSIYYYRQRAITTVIVAFLSFGALSSQHLEEYLFSGYLRSRSDSSAVAYAHVFVSDMSSFAISDTLGFFSLRVESGDTVLISSLQYEPRGLVITKPPPRETLLWLRPKIYELSEVRVYADDVLRGFFSHQRLDYKRVRSHRFHPTSPSVAFGGGSNDALPSITIDGLLTSLLEPLTSEYRQMKKLHELYQRRRIDRYYKNLLTQRVSVDFVQKHLLLRANEVRDFLEFWKPEALFLELSSDYELISLMRLAKLRYLEHLLRVHSYRGYKDPVTTIELRELLAAPVDIHTFEE